MTKPDDINFKRRDHAVEAFFYRMRTSKLVGQFLVFVLCLAVVGGLFRTAQLASSGVHAKTLVLGATTDALSHLEQAQNLVGQQNVAGTEEQLAIAHDDFVSAQQNVSNLGGLITSVLALTVQGQSAQALLNAGERITDAGINLGQFYNTATLIKISPQGLQSPDGFYQTVGSAEVYLHKANSDLAEAQNALSGVDPSVLPAQYQDKYGQYRSALDASVNALQSTSDLLGVFQSFIGQYQKNILVLFENNNELRPGGGFIGTYGYYRLNDGTITSQKISSIYDLDGQLTSKIAPPGEFKDLTDHWGLRDSNWFADFTQSAQKASAFYEQEGLETPDAVIAVTPDLFVDILKVTGPIDFPKYNLTLDADNFRDTVQANTSTAPDAQTTTPKQMLADFAPLLFQRIATLSSKEQAGILAAFIENLNEKNILIYDRNPDVESALSQYNWTGEILPADGDYLAVLNANLGGRKTDLEVNQTLNLHSAVQSDGSIIDTLTFTRAHQQDPSGSASFQNIDYARFLVPQGSQLLSATGFTKRDWYPSDGSAYLQNNIPFVQDPDLKQIDATTKIDSASGTAIAVEAGKTSFGNWIETLPGQSSTVTLTYKLPFRFDASPAHSLLIQKQPGNTAIELTAVLDSPRKIVWQTPDSASVDAHGALNFKTSLAADTLVGFVTDR